MSSENQPIATSTPKPITGRSSVLQEKLTNNAGYKETNQRPLQKKVNFIQKSTVKVKSKENFKNGSSSSKRRRSENDDKKEVQRRQQALEAMQILEQRRQRMSQQNLSEEMEELSLKSPLESRDEMMEKKRLEAKRLKEKRIRAHLAEQEALKKKKELEAAAQAIYQQKPRPNVPRPKQPTFPNSRLKGHIAYKPSCQQLILPKVVEEDEPCQHSTFKKMFLRYSKDELRLLNPYGYYFM